MTRNQTFEFAVKALKKAELQGLELNSIIQTLYGDFDIKDQIAIGQALQDLLFDGEE